MSNDRGFTGEQVAMAARELREAAGAEEERFSSRQVLSMLGEELRLLRERGFTPEQIANLLTGIDVPVSANEVTEAENDPRFH